MKKCENCGSTYVEVVATLVEERVIDINTDTIIRTTDTYDIETDYSGMVCSECGGEIVEETE